jgi:hypothetical protein
MNHVAEHVELGIVPVYQLPVHPYLLCFLERHQSSLYLRQLTAADLVRRTTVKGLTTFSVQNLT